LGAGERGGFTPTEIKQNQACEKSPREKEKQNEEPANLHRDTRRTLAADAANRSDRVELTGEANRAIATGTLNIATGAFLRVAD
jgi:hypothetical protein